MGTEAEAEAVEGSKPMWQHSLRLLLLEGQIPRHDQPPPPLPLPLLLLRLPPLIPPCHSHPVSLPPAPLGLLLMVPGWM